MKRLFKNGRLISLPTLPVTTCEGCGACCRHMGAPPGYEECWRREGMNPDDLARWLKMPLQINATLIRYYLKVERGEVSSRTIGKPNDALYARAIETCDPFDVNKMLAEMLERNRTEKAIPCLWLDLETMKCKHYEYRPEVCRDPQIDPGTDACLATRKAFRIPLPVAT